MKTLMAFFSIIASAIVILGAAFIFFMVTSPYQSKYFSKISDKSTYNAGPPIDLKDGRFLINEYDIYSTKKNRTAPLKGKMHCTRNNPLMLEIKNHKVLFYGGYTNFNPPQCRNEVLEILDLKTEQFKPVFNGKMTLSRTKAVVLSDGRVLFVGGSLSREADKADAIVLFDPKTEKFKNMGHLIIPRREHSLIVLPNDNVLVVGGVFSAKFRDDRPQIWDITMVEEISSKTFQSAPLLNLKFNRISPPSLLMLDKSHVLVVGGVYPGADPKWDKTPELQKQFREEILFGTYAKEPIEIIDLKNKKSFVASSFPTIKAIPAVFPLPDGKIIIMGGGGRVNNEARRQAYNGAYVFDPDNNQLQFLDWLPIPYMGQAATQTTHKDIYLFWSWGIQKFNYQKYQKERR